MLFRSYLCGDSIHGLDHVFNDFLRIAEDHHGLVHVEEFVVQACIACRHGTLVHNNRLGLVGLQNRHAINRAALLQGGRVDHVVGAQDDGHVGLAKFTVDVFHFKDLVVGHFGLGQQDVHVAGHAPRHRMDGVFDGHAFFGQLGGEFFDRVLGTGHGQTVARDNDHGFGIAHDEGRIVGTAAFDAALLLGASSGGAGVTTLAIETALLLLQSGARGRPGTCLVDLNFQNGTCADYLDLEPRLDLKEIEPRPERLDRQLLEIMLSHHASGLAVIAAPPRPAEMRSFDPEMVTRLLDLVSSNFDYVVIDMPRTWFSWTDSVLLGSNRLFIVSEMTVPGLRHAKQMVAAIRERLGEGPSPQVIVNRFEQRLFSPGLKKSDIEQALGADFAAVIPNHYRLVREAIDRGVPIAEVKPGNAISTQLKKLILPQNTRKEAAPQPSGLGKKLSLSWAK